MAKYRMIESMVEAEEFMGPGSGTVKIGAGGRVTVRKGDFIVKNHCGEVSVCAGNMFHQMFEKVAEVFDVPDTLESETPEPAPAPESEPESEFLTPRERRVSEN